MAVDTFLKGLLRMAKVFKSDLTVKGLRQLKKALREYQQVTLTDNLHYIVQELCNLGKTTAQATIGSPWGAYVSFETDVQDTKYNYKVRGVMYGFNSSINIVTWIGKGEIQREAEVNSILMAEFGSGQYASPASMRGTFPHQTHAFQNVWYWKSLDGKWEHSSGVKPQRPMRMAYLNMMKDYEQIAIKAMSR